MKPIEIKGYNVVEDNIYPGDTWRGFTVKGTAGGADPTDLLPAIKSIRLQFRKLNKRFVYELNTETASEFGLPKDWPNNVTGCISILDAALWTFSVNAQPLPMGTGKYLWELEITDIMNTVHTFMHGKINIC